MKILVSGANGQVGWELNRQGEQTGHEVVALTRQALDISDPDAVDRAIAEFAPDAVINAAAYTAVDRAEDEPGLAFAINRDGPANLAAACQQAGIPLLHISTDYVFDGTRPEPYTELVNTSPLGVYGHSKWEGEEAVRDQLPRHIILRTAWVFGIHGNNFVRTILRVAAEREQLTVVADQQGAPTSARSIAACLLRICSLIELNAGDISWGTYHFSGTPYTSWHGFASEIVERGYELGLLPRPVRVLPISTAEFPTKAERPANSRLICKHIETELGISPDRWVDDLRDMLEQIRNEDTTEAVAG